jgi:hypothetical protein
LVYSVFPHVKKASSRPYNGLFDPPEKPVALTGEFALQVMKAF